MFFSQVLDFLWVFFILFYFSVPYFGLACDHGNSFLCLEEKGREGYWIEVRTVFNVKTTTTTTTTSIVFVSPTSTWKALDVKEEVLVLL